MRNIKNKAVVFVTAAAMTVAGFTGCGKLNTAETVAKVNDTEISLGLANFYIRYQQGVYETQYAELMGGAEAMWATEVEEDKTYAESTKEKTVKMIEQMCIIEDHMSEYDVEITAEEKEAIKKAAEAFAEANGEEELELVSGEEDTVERMLTLMTIQKKVYDEVVKEADTKVDEEEYLRKGMKYVLFPFTTQDKDGKTKTLNEDEKKDLKKQAEDFASTVKKTSDFTAFADKVGYTPVDGTFGKDTTSPTEELVKELNTLKVGEVSGVYEGSAGYYVATVTSERDEEATEKEKEKIIQTRQNEKFQEVCKEWEKESDITETFKLLKKIDFKNQGVTLKAPEKEAEEK